MQLCGKEYDVVAQKGRILFSNGEEEFTIAIKSSNPEIEVRKIVPKNRFLKTFLMELVNPATLLPGSGLSFWVNFPFSEEIVVDGEAAKVIECGPVKLTLIPNINVVGGYLKARNEGNVKIILKNLGHSSLTVYGIVVFATMVTSPNDVIVVEIYQNSLKIKNRGSNRFILVPRNFLLDHPPR